MSESARKQLDQDVSLLNDKILDLSGTDILVIFYPAKWGKETVQKLGTYFKARLCGAGLENRIFVVPNSVRVECVAEGSVEAAGVAGKGDEVL